MPTSEREKEIVGEYLIHLQLLIRSGEEPASLGQPESLAVLVKVLQNLQQCGKMPPSLLRGRRHGVYSVPG